MTRRRLRLRYSSDEEEEEEDGTGTSGIADSVQSVGVAPTVQPETSPASTSNPNPGETIDVSEVEIIDVSGNPTPSPPDSSIHTPYPVDPPESEGRNDYESPIGEVLSRKGIKLKTEWWVSCLSGLERSVPRFSGLDVAAKAKHCFEQFLFSDMNLCGGGVLPRNVASLNLVELAGPFVLQVDEIVNIGCPLKGRYENANPGLKRCLKLSMTDGVQRVFGMEYRPIKDLQVLAPAGLKIVVSSVQVRHGILMLVPEIVEVLGGMVEELEEARQRLLVEVNKPPRGKRTRNGVVPSLATRATLAAWSLNDNDTGSNHVDSSTTGNESHAQANGQGIPPNVTRTHINSRNEPPASFNVETTVSRVEHMQIDTSSVHGEREFSDIRSTSSNIHRTAAMHGERVFSEIPPTSSNIHRTAAMHGEREFSDIRSTSSNVHRTAAMHGERVFSEIRSTSSNINRTAATTSCSGTTRSFSNNVGENTLHQQTSNVISFVEEMHIDNGLVRDTTPVYGSVSGSGSDAVVEDAEVSNMVIDLETPSVISTYSERPFTYIAELAKKWAVMKDTMHFVQGRIKCFLTGVKKFQFKQQSTFELLCYVDDGSLICEILLHNDVVQKRIGHSSMEVTGALSSSATTTVSAMMKEKLKRFQSFLSEFEGIMVVEMNRTSQYPVAIEMNQGCSLTDPRLLFERIKSCSTRRTSIDPVVVLSP